MRAVWFNCCAGVAGDMLLASLIDAGADRMAVTDAWSAIGVSGYAATWERVQRCGVTAMWTNLVIDDVGTNDHHHDAHDDHRHRQAADVIELIRNADLPPGVGERAVAVYRVIAEVEAAIHGIDPDTVELHEVGALDSILDVVGVCAALNALEIEVVRYSPIAVGHGTVRTAHGLLPNPVPAVSRLLERAGATTTGIDTEMELATPTGVALVTVLGEACGPIPSMTITSNGFGAGTADPPGRPNVVHAIVGELTAGGRDRTGRPARLVEANVDDVTGEVLAHALAQLLSAGAFDAWATPIVMKKGRPAHTISALCDDATFAAVCEAMIAETGTLGIRATHLDRWPQHRIDDKVEVNGYTIRVKRGAGRIKVEHDDAAAAAQALGLPLREVLARAEAAARELG
jgi:uncharacterized protein (TIGR00299 family) protein